MQKQVSFLLLILVVLGAIAFFIHDQENLKRVSSNKSGPLLLENKLLSNITPIPLSIELIDSEGVLLMTKLNDISNNEGVLTSAHLNTLINPESKRLALLEYPIEQKRVAALVRSVLKTKIIEPKSARDEHQVHLGLVAPTIAKDLIESESVSESGTGTLLTLRFAEPNKPISLIIGNRAERIKGQYVRFKNSKQMFLVDQQFSLPANKFAWLKQYLLDLNLDDILNIRRTGPNQWQINVNAGETNLVNLQKDEVLKHSNALTDYANTLNTLQFESLMPYTKAVWDDFELVLILQVTTQSGQTHGVRIAAAENNSDNQNSRSESSKRYYVLFNAEGEYAHLNNWIYQISANQAQALLKVRSDFIAPSQ